MKKIISLDSQILNTIQLCARKVKYQFVDHLVMPEISEPLERGSLLHDIFEIYYGMIGGCYRLDSDLWKESIEAGIVPSEVIEDRHPFHRDFSAQLAVTVARMRASKITLPLDEVDSVIFQFSEYHKFYEHDGWIPLAVEEVGSKVLFDSPDLQIVYNFKIDAVMQNNDKIWPFDHKTSKKRTNPSSMSNQFIGYCFGINSLNIIVNKIGFQKTLAPSERFQRDIITYNKNRIIEWTENTVWWAKILADFVETDNYPMNLTSCDKYNGCLFENICKREEDLRELIKERDYKIGQEWDVAKVLEGITEE